MTVTRRTLTRIGVGLGAIVLIVLVVLALGGNDKPTAASSAEAPAPAPTTMTPILRTPSNQNETTTSAPTTPRTNTTKMPTTTVYRASEGGGSGSCATGVTPLASGVFNVTVNGSARSYTVRVPPNYKASKPYRLLLAFHWHGGTMADVATKFFYYGMLLHQNETTILIAPQGLENAWKNNGGEDIAFMKQILAAVESRLCVDPRQRYAMGFSYGASMTHAVACAMGAQFRAVSVLSGGEYSGTCEAPTPVAYMIMHGLRDTVIPIEKGRALRDTFVQANNCTVPATPPAEPKEGDLNHIRTAYTGCSSGHPVEWTVFDDAHTAMPLDGSLMLNSTATWMPQAVWTFFSQFM